MKIRAHRERFSRSFGTNETQHLREGQLVGRMLLQRLATGATGVKQARYRSIISMGEGLLGSHSYAHAQYNIVSVSVCQCVQASHPLLTQLQDQVDIPMDSVSCSLQNEFGVFRIMASFRR